MLKCDETVEIKKHGNSYVDVTHCPECGGEESEIIKTGEWGHSKFIFYIYGDGKLYKCKECGCEYLICKTNKIMLRRFTGFAGVLCFCTALILICTAICFLLHLISIVLTDNTINFIDIIGTIVSTFLCAFFFYLCRSGG